MWVVLSSWLGHQMWLKPTCTSIAECLSQGEWIILEIIHNIHTILDTLDGLRQLSAFRRRQPDLLTLPTLSVNDVANLIAMEVEKRGYEGVGACILRMWISDDFRKDQTRASSLRHPKTLK